MLSFPLWLKGPRYIESKISLIQQTFFLI